MRLRFLSLLLVALSSLAWGQGSCILFPSTLTSGSALTDAKSYICTKGTSANACVSGSNSIAAYSDETLGPSFALTQPVNADSTGNTYLCVLPGTYEVCVTSAHAANPYCWNQQFFSAPSTSQPNVTVSPQTIAFGSVTVGQSVSQTVLLNNVGSAGAPITSISTSDTTNFPIGNTCPGTLLPGNSCTVTSTFSPGSAGALSASITVSISGLTSTTVSLTGTGVTPPPTPPTVSSLALTPATSTITVGSTQAYNATDTMSDSSTQVVTTKVAYNSGASGSSTIGFVQSVKCAWTGSNGANFACPSATNTAGNLIVVFTASSQTSTMSVTDSIGNTYVCGATDGSRAICYATNKSTGTNTITIHGTSGNVAGQWMEFSNVASVDSATPTGQTGSNGGGATNQADSITYTTTGANDLVVMCAIDASGTWTAGTGFTLAQSDSAYSEGCEYKLNVAAGSITPVIVDGSSTTTWKTYSFAFVGKTSSVATMSASASAILAGGGSNTATGVSAGSATISANSAFLQQTAIQSGCGTSASSVTSQPCGFFNPNVAGDTIVAIALWRDATTTFSGFTDTAGNSYVSKASSQGSGLSAVVSVAQGIAGATNNTVTGAWSGGGAATPIIMLFEVSGLVATPNIDIATASNAGNALCSPGSLSAAQAAEILIMGCIGPSGSNVLNSNGDNVGSQGTAFSVADLFASGTAANPLTVSGGSSSAAAAISLKSVIGTAALTVNSGSTTIYTVKNPPAVGTNWYSGSLFTTPLPASAAGSGHDASYSTCAIQLEFGGTDTSGCSGGSEENASTTSINYRNCNGLTSASFCGGGLWYSSQSDPIYEVVTCSICGPGSHNPVGKFFHIKNQAEWSGNQGDQFLRVWDQSSDIDSTIGGRFLSSYFFVSPPSISPRQLGNCTCTTTSCAASTPACQINGYYMSYGYPFNDSTSWGEDVGGYQSIGVAAGTMMIRSNEVVAGNIPHAILFNDGGHHFCGPVFPATAGESGSCQTTDSNWVREGSLLTLDTGYNCSTVPPGVTTAVWNNLIKPFCIQMQTYGDYLTDVGGDNHSPFVIDFDSGYSYTAAGFTDPLLTLVQSSVGSSNCSGGFCKDGQSGAVFGYNVGYYQDNSGFLMHIMAMPGALSHFHIKDPCVAKAMAGQPGGCP